MGLLSQITAYATVIAALNGVLTEPEAPSMPPPTVLTIQSNDDYQIEDNVRIDAINTSENQSLTNNIDVSGVAHSLINGIDISSHQHSSSSNINVQKVIDSGEINFLFVKATEGTNYVNKHFRDDVVTAINSNTPVGYYHYARPTADPEEAREQARFFAKVTGIDNGVKGLPPVLDIEEDEGLTPQQLIDWTEAYVDEIRVITGKDTMIYTYPTFWRDKMNNTPLFNYLPLWIADYNNSATPSMPLPGGWKDWTFWQYTSNERITGVDQGVDGNIFNGSYIDLLRKVQ